MTPAIAKIIDEAKERVAKEKAAQLAKKEKANAARLAKLNKGKDARTKSASKGTGNATKQADAASTTKKSSKPNVKIANAEPRRS